MTMTTVRPRPIDIYDDDLLGGGSSSDVVLRSSGAGAGERNTTTMSASSPSQGAHTQPPLTNTTPCRQEEEDQRRRKKKKKKHAARRHSSKRNDHAEHNNHHGHDEQQDDHHDDDHDDDYDDRLVTIRIQTNDNHDNNNGTTVWTCPYSLLERRELEMQRAAQSFGIPSTRWSASLIFNLVCQELADNHHHHHHHNQEQHGNDNDLDITICPNMNVLLRQYQPSDQHEHDDDNDDDDDDDAAVEWPLWLTNLILGYYETGQLIVPNACQGQDLLLALEYFAILYAPDQLVFESYNAYERVRIWSEYLTQRALLATWIDESIAATITRRKRTVSSSSSSLAKKLQQQYVFYFGTATNPLERLCAGPKSMPLSIFHGTNAADDSSNNNNNNMCRVVYRLFNPSHENQVSEELCRDFCRYLQQVLSTTNDMTGERTIVQAQFAFKMIHVEANNNNNNNKTKKKRLQFEESSADETSCSNVRESNSSFREERAVLKVVVVLFVGPDDDDYNINNNNSMDDYQQLNSETTDSIQSPYMNNDKNLLATQEKMLLEAVTTPSYVDSVSAFTPQPQSLEYTRAIQPKRPGRSPSPCISIISSNSRPSSPTSIGSGSNRNILKYRQPFVRSATIGTETSRATPYSCPMDEKSVFSGQTGWSEGMGPPPLSITPKKKQHQQTAATTTAKSSMNTSNSPKDATVDIYNNSILHESADHQQQPQPQHLRRRKSSWRKGDEPLQQALHPPPPLTPTTTDGIASGNPSPTTLDPVFGSHEEPPTATAAAGGGTDGAAISATAAATTSAATAAKTKAPNNTTTTPRPPLHIAPVSVIGFDNQTVTSALTVPFFAGTGGSSLQQLEQAQSLSEQQQRQAAQDAPPDLSKMATISNSNNKKLGSASFESSSAGKESEEVRAQALHHEWVQGSYMNRDISTRVRELLKAEEERTKQATAVAAAAASATTGMATEEEEETTTAAAAAHESPLVVDAGTTKSSSNGGGVGKSADQQPQKTNRTKQRANQVQYNDQSKYKGRRLGYSDIDDDMPPKALEVSSAESSTTSDDPSTVATVDGSLAGTGCESSWDRLFNYVCDLGSECLQPIDGKDCGGARSKQRSKQSQRGRTGRPPKRIDKQTTCLSELPNFEKTGVPTPFPIGWGYFNSQPGRSNRNDGSDDDNSSSSSDSTSSTSSEVQQVPPPPPKATKQRRDARAARAAQRIERAAQEIQQPEQQPKPSKNKGRNEKHNEKEQQLQQKLQLQQQQHQNQNQQQQQQQQKQPHRKNSGIIEIPVKQYMRQIVQQQLDQPTTHVAPVDEKHAIPPPAPAARQSIATPTRSKSPLDNFLASRNSSSPARKSIASTPTRQTSPLAARGLALRNSSSPAKIRDFTAAGQQQQQAADRRTPSRGRGNVASGGGGQQNGSNGGLFRKIGSTKKAMENGNSKEAVSSSAAASMRVADTAGTTTTNNNKPSGASAKGFRFWKKKTRDISV